MLVPHLKLPDRLSISRLMIEVGRLDANLRAELRTIMPMVLPVTPESQAGS